MERKSKLKWVIGLIIVVLIALLLIRACLKENESGYQAEAVQPLLQQKEVVVLAFPFNPNQTQLTQDDVLYGNAAILIFDSVGTELERAQGPHLHYFSQRQILKLFDTGNQGRIDETDPSFVHIKLLVFYDKGKVREVVSAYDAGVRAIFLDKSQIENSQGYMGKGSTVDAHRIVMSDGTSRPIVDVTIQTKYLSETENIDKLVVTPPEDSDAKPLD